MTTSSARSGLFDRLAIAVSTLCLVHCLATAVLVGLVSTVGSVLGDPLIHEVGLAIALALGVIALGQGVLRHRRVLPAAIGGLGLGAMAGALALPHGPYEAAVTMVGVTILAVGHWLNRRYAH